MSVHALVKVCWTMVLTVCSLSVRTSQKLWPVVNLAICVVRTSEVIPNGEHELYVERVVDSSRYWVLKIVAWLH